MIEVEISNINDDHETADGELGQEQAKQGQGQPDTFQPCAWGFESHGRVLRVGVGFGADYTEPSLKWRSVAGSVRDLSEDFNFGRLDPFR